MNRADSNALNVRLWFLGLPLGAIIIGAVLFFFNPTTSNFYPICLFHAATGLHCPGCGTLRALHHLLHGQIAAAVHYNALVICSLPLIGTLVVRSILATMKHQ